ncbi:MAG: toll/interleukin-1 receptor domain-containing protein [Clostridium sp.]|nr:toll/interleukin-1 receptor domain-containing protein [Acetatifactor muris]MCM1528258.1 toll/interleukin-1 receptor domain-containing protein [Bacteroides sp.]MCM1563482.1 toll/interleukin-1 receptor domain-containing protein [Clostridium sp.]
MQIFISHSSKDAAEAKKICDLLERNGTKCFIAPRDIRSGQEYAEELVNAIDSSTAVVLLMSRSANRSPHVLREVERAVSRSIPILMYKLEDVSLSKSMEYFLRIHQRVNAGDGEAETAILQFVKNLETRDDTQPSETAGETGAILQISQSRKKPSKMWAAALILAAVLLVAGGVYYAVTGNVSNREVQTVTVGDTVTFGSYNGEEIRWRVLKLSDDGTRAVLVAADILSMKAFDAAESGKYNWYDHASYWSRESEADTDMELQAMVRGNSDWSVSNIRTWLNSDDEVVVYADQPPESGAMAELKNGYQNEAGFLHGFTEEELSAVVEVENVTNANALSEGATVTTTDRVYLLSLEELAWFDEAGISKYAVPTQAAVDRDNSNWYVLDRDDLGVNEYCWWLREPVEHTASQCYLVGNGYTKELLRQENVGLEGFGVRPALTVDLRAVNFDISGSR